MKKTIAVLAGDGIGPEVMSEGIRVLQSVAQKFRHDFKYEHVLVGGAAFEVFGEHCPSSTIETCANADAILFGSVGGPVNAQDDSKWKNCEANSILALRKKFKFNINIRPIAMISSLMDISPLKAEVIQSKADIVIFRELNGDIYFGAHEQSVDDNGVRYATDVAEYNEHQIASIVHPAFKAAQNRGKHLTSVDKANVLATSKLWRTIVDEIAPQYPDVKVNHMYVDNCAMQMIVNPSQFDVIVTANLFGDILSDLGAVLPGSLGLIPSVSLNAEGFGLYEPSGGSAPDIAGQGKANPIAQILSAAMMLEYSFNMLEEANAIYQAVNRALTSGKRTIDIAGSAAAAISLSQMTDAIIAEMAEVSVT